MMERLNFEEVYSELLVEYILYLRDRNPEKNWGHIWWWTTVFSYSRWNKKKYIIPCPKDKYINFSFASVSIERQESVFTKDQQYFIEKYSLFHQENMFLCPLEEKDKEIYPFIFMILDWKKWNFTKKVLNKYSLKNSFLFSFLYALSNFEERRSSYYFKFSEMFSKEDILFLNLSIKRKKDYLFSLIALASASFHNWKKEIAYHLYLKALDIDPDNPRILWKLSLLYISLWTERAFKDALNLIEKVQNLLPLAPWVYAWSWEIANTNKLFFLCLKNIERYDEITSWKHRTFEPYLRKAEALYFLWNFKASRQELQKKELYYFWEWYHFQYNILDEKLRLLWY